MKAIAATLALVAVFAVQQEASKPAAQPVTGQAQSAPAAKPAESKPEAPIVLPAEFKDEAKMALPAEQVFKNVVFFKGKPASELRDYMLRMKAQTAHDCAACHDTNNWADASKNHHKIAVQMLQLTELANTSLYPKNPTKVTCWTCHRSKDQPERLPRVQNPPELDVYNSYMHLTPEQEAKPAVEVFKNLKLVPKDVPAKQLANIMVYFSRSLGVPCNHCHDTTLFESDRKGEKETARRMYEMVLKSKDTIYANERNTRMNCAGCHHGHVEPDDTPKEMREAHKTYKPGM